MTNAMPGLQSFYWVSLTIAAWVYIVTTLSHVAF